MISLRLKTVLGVAAIEGVLLAILIYTAIQFMSDTINKDMIKRANTTASLFAATTKDSVLSYDLASLNTFIDELLKSPDIEYVRILNSEGEILSSGGQPSSLKREFKEDYQVAEVDDGIFDVSSDIIEANEIYGRVEIGISITSIEKAMVNVRNWTVSIAILEMSLVALFSFALGIYLTKNLKKLQRAALTISRSIEKGQHRYVRAHVVARDEIGDLATAFNRLSENLEKEQEKRAQFEKDLKELNANLDEKVKKRTLMIDARNKQLIRINNELQSTQEQLVHSEKMASIGQLAAGVAHEINNPIAFVSSNMQTLEEYTSVYIKMSEVILDYINNPSDDRRIQLTEYLVDINKKEDLQFVAEDIHAIINDSVDGLGRVRSIVSSLNQFARNDDNALEYASLNDCVNTVLKMVDNQLKYHCEVITDLSDIPDVPMNLGKMTQVITNLLINAGQAIVGRGNIWVQTRSKRNEVELIVRDSGKGIPEKNLQRLFDPFFTTKPVGKGTGLGLSISYDIVKEHGGTIQVKSEEGKGTTFIVRLPKESYNNVEQIVQA